MADTTSTPYKSTARPFGLKFPSNILTMPRCIGIQIRERELIGQASPTFTTTGKTIENTSTIDVLKEGTSGVVSGVGTGIKALQALAKLDFKTSDKAFIYLPLPNNISTDHTADWSGRGLTPLEYAMRKVGEAGGDIGVFGQAYGYRMALSGASLLTKKLASKVATGTPIDAAGAAVMAGAQMTMNPYHQLMYSGPNFRTFSFDWVLSPSNASEAKAIEGIIWMLKKYMHTSSTTQEMFFAFPAYASIAFFETKEESKSHLFDIKDCAITSVNVHYERKFHDDGQPIAVRLIVNFLESVVLTQTDFPDEQFDYGIMRGTIEHPESSITSLKDGLSKLK